MNFSELTALETGELIRLRKMSVTEAVTSALDAAEALNPKLNSFITICREKALKRAAEVQKRITDGTLSSPLAGVPVAVKDNICTEGIRTTCASKMLENFVPFYSATAVERLERAGAVIIGKLNMDEFAMGSTSETSYFGPVRNPHDISRTPGGSSSGCAAAVASGIVSGTFGSDTGGSVRQPAGYCGVTGFKPTYGAVSRYGLIAYASSFDQIGPICGDAADCAAFTDAVCGRDERDSTSRDMFSGSLLSSLTGDVKGLRIGVLKESLASDKVDFEVSAKVAEVIKEFEKAGAVIKKVSFPYFDEAFSTYYTIAMAEASSNLARFDGVKYGFRAADYEDLNDLYCSSRSEGFGEEVKKRILLGTTILSGGYYDAYYLKAMKWREIIKAELNKIFSETDLLLTPTAPETAPLAGRSVSDPVSVYYSDIYTVLANLAGLPSVSFPCGTDRNGMPVGAQFTGRAADDGRVLNAVHVFQLMTDYHKLKADLNIQNGCTGQSDAQAGNSPCYQEKQGVEKTYEI